MDNGKSKAEVVGISQEQMDRLMVDAADSIPDEKVTRADGTIDGAKLIEEMFGK